MNLEEKELLFKETDELLAIYREDPPITNEGFDAAKLKSTYEKMMNRILPQDEYKAIWQWMESSDFFKSPASTIFHGNFETGLAVHTMQVIYQSLKFARPVLTEYFESKVGEYFFITAKDIFVSALAHDFCKAGSYEINFRNTKDIFGNWVKQSYFKTKGDLRNLGHGNESVLILLELVPSYTRNRTVIEAVSRHMGFSDLSDIERLNYSNFLNNPLVLLLQLADQTAAAWYDN